MSRYDDNAPWDDGVYGTGRTQPPKSYGGLIAFLLILIIFLIGVVTMLGLMNIRLFRQLSSAEKRQELSVSYVSENVPAENLVPIETSPMILSRETPAPAQNIPESGSMALQDIYEKCIPSVVSILASRRTGVSTGTGVILSAQGYVVTNYHVIEDATGVNVQLTDDRVCSAWVVGSDPASDLAVLQISADGLVSAEFGNSEVLRVGDAVVAIGDPLGVEYRGTMTNGIVSAINRNMNVNGRFMNLIQTNAALNSGNSGGPLINNIGQVIGINTIKVGAFTDSAGVEGIGFAIPSTTVKDIVEQIIQQGYVSGRPWIGLTGESVSLFYQRYYRLPAGMYITSIASGSNAEEIGLQMGDILISIDGTKVYSQNDLETLLYNYSAGDVVNIVIYRSGRTMQADLELEEAGNAAG